MCTSDQGGNITSTWTAWQSFSTRKENVCSDCVCRYCLYWWSGRCPYGECYDDHRAEADPYDVAHPTKSPRTHWSNWDQPGEQAHWCRGGALYPSTDCEHFIQYEGQKVSGCYRAAVSEFQDGYIVCSVREAMSCEACMKDMAEKLQGREKK